MNITETVKNLPELPVVYACSMRGAQSWKPSAEERSAIKARQDFFRSLDLPADVNINVRDVYNGALIGHLVFAK